MKIKTKKKMRLDELIKHKRAEGSKHYITIESDNGLYEARLNGSHLMYVAKNNCERDKIFPEMHFDTTFTVEVEEELTEEKKFDVVVVVYKEESGKINADTGLKESIKDIKYHWEKHFPQVKVLKVFALFGSDMPLIWSRESGIPEEGVLEVEADVQ